MQGGRSLIQSPTGADGSAVEPAARPRRAWAWFRGAIGLAMAGLLLWLASREVNWQDLRAVLGQTRWGWLAVTWLFVALALPVKGLRWKIVLGEGGEGLSWARLTAVFAVGQLVNSVIPLRMGELSRAYLVHQMGKGRFAQALGTIVVEKTLDGVALLAIALVLGLSLSLPDWFSTAAWTYGVVIGGILLLVLCGVLLRDRLQSWSERLPRRLSTLVSSGLDGLAGLRERGVLLAAGLLTACVWLLGFASNYVLFEALGIQAPAAAALLLLVVHYLAVLIPGVPAQVGLFHYVTVLALDVFAIGAGQAMPYALVLHGLIYGNMILFGLIGALSLSVGLGELIRATREPRRSKAG